MCFCFDGYRKVKTLADDDEEDALAWVRRNRKQDQDRLMAEKRVCLYFCFSNCNYVTLTAKLNCSSFPNGVIRVNN